MILAEAYGLSISEARQQIYVEALIDLDPDEVKKGVGHIIKTRTFAGNLPSVAEIREAVAGNGVPIETRAALAWDEALKAVHDHGPYQSPSFSDPITSHIIIAWGGWIEFGNWPAEETKWKRKEFIQLYEAYAASNRLPEAPDHLIGITEGNNRDHFPEFVPEPVHVGYNGESKKRLT